jgi:hypothetical protein
VVVVPRDSHPLHYFTVFDSPPEGVVEELSELAGVRFRVRRELVELSAAYRGIAEVDGSTAVVIGAWGVAPTSGLPDALHHRRCGHRLTPTLACQACGEDADITRMGLKLEPVPALLKVKPRLGRAPRIPVGSTPHVSLGLRVDRWSLLIVTAVVLGCHHFDQLSQVLGIGPSVLARRLE